jgi:hypothetical protein
VIGRGRALASALLAVAVLAACGAPAAPARRTPAPGQTLARPAWIVTAGGLQRLKQAGLPQALLEADFDDPGTLLLVQQGRPDPLVPRASPTFAFGSAASLVDALHRNRVPAAVRWLLLDLEYWPLTPAGEQRDPIGALRRAVAAAHAAGRSVVFTPAIDLLSALEPGRAPGWPARYAGAPASDFERLIVTPGAALADAFEVQAQQAEATPYAATFAPQVLAVARAAHPGAPVLVGLSTNPNGRRVGAGDLLTLYRSAAAAGADGYWLNIPQAGRECPKCGVPQPQVGVQFLESLPSPPRPSPSRPEAGGSGRASRGR